MKQENYIPRLMGQTAHDIATWLPIVSVTGPRQSGKSTLVRKIFEGYSYVNLEDAQVRAMANVDPVGFLAAHPAPLIVDEAQLVPELFPQIQAVSDEIGREGNYVLSGSQNFLLLKRISESLAGRVGIVRLLPLSFFEVHAVRKISYEQFLFRGGYPRLYNVKIPERVFYDSYVSTYIERDVADYLDVRNISAFRRFLSLCAQNVGSLLNVTRLASDVGIAQDTVRSWLSILESSYIVFRLQPYFTNLRKRITKTPKLYFYDTGLLCYLLGIDSQEQMITSPYYGAIFENFVVEEAAKRYLNSGREPRLFFYRDDSKVEVDLVDATNACSIELLEIKSSQTFRSEFGRHLVRVGDALNIPAKRRIVVSRASGSFSAKDFYAVNIEDWLLRKDKSRS